MQAAAKKYLPKEFIPVNTNIHHIECPSAWSYLTKKEKLYAYYLSRASWEGAKICWFQRSYESPGLFVLLKLLFSQDMQRLKQQAVEKAALNDTEWRQLLAYSAAVFENHGNYKSFGDCKFVPQLEQEKFHAVLKHSDSYETHHEIIDTIFGLVSKEVYCEEDPYRLIGFRDSNGTTSYYSSNITNEEAKKIDDFCKEHKISPLNTRLFKLKENEYEMRIASWKSDDQKTKYLGTYKYQDYNIHVVAQDFSDIMQKVVSNMEKSLYYTANENQKNMIKDYIEHFQFGDIDKHKDSQRHWIKDVGPVVETDIGFIETYLDPLGARAEFEGFVAVVDKVISAKFNKLVEDAESLIAYLPWGKDFEKDKFSKPDFTNLDVLTFACSGVPIGINIPNYDDIRMEQGFKNVNLGNAYPKPNKNTLLFMTEDDVNMMLKYDKQSLTLIVALHELLGHGTGKLLTKNIETGELNFPAELKNPFTGQPITTFYLSNETWSQKFGKLHSGYEECRADSVALYLMHYDEPFNIFFSDCKPEWDNIYYVAWLDIFYGAIKGLQYYDPAGKAWGQAHVLASYAIFKVVREYDPSIITFEFTKNAEGKDWFILHVDRSKLRTGAFTGLKEFLNKLHIYKSMGDFDEGKKLFDHYSEVDEELLKVRQIVIDNKVPRRLNLQDNLYLDPATGEPQYKGYEATFEGIIQSSVERYPDPFQEDVFKEWIKDVQLLRRVD